MRYRFKPDVTLIIVKAVLCGPSGEYEVRLVLDTGSTHTLIDPAPLRVIGYNPSDFEEIEIAAVGGMEKAAKLKIDRIKALGQEKADLLLLCTPIPRAAKVDGTLGLDFMRGHILRLDLQRGILDFE